MTGNIYGYILVMAVVTYLIRMLPLTVWRKESSSRYVKSFLHYMPFVTLAAMTVPGALDAGQSVWSGGAGLLAAAWLALRGVSMFGVAAAACSAVFAAELLLS